MRRERLAAADVARLAGIPRQRIYDVLGEPRPEGARLAAARAAGEVRGRRARARDRAPASPTGARSSTALERDAEEMIDAARRPRSRQGQKERDPLEYIEVLRDRAAINERFGELQAGIQRRDPRLHQAAVRDAAAGERRGPRGRPDATSRRSVYEFSRSTTRPSPTGVRRFIEAGEEARFVEELPLKLVIIDETIVMFGMEDPVAGAPT